MVCREHLIDFCFIEVILFYQVICETVNLVCEIDKLHIALIVVNGCRIVKLHTATGEVIYSAIDVIGLNSDMTVRSVAFFVHKLDSLCGEYGRGCLSLRKGEDMAKGVCRILACVTAGIDADVLELEAEHCVDCLANQSCDAVKVA